MFTTDNKAERPIIQLEYTSTDKILDGLALFFLVMLLALPAAYYTSLPDSIPTHFNYKGEADRWGSKAQLWLLPAIGLFAAALTHFFGKKPHTFNYLQRITPENAPYQYRNATTMMRTIRAAVLLLFSYLCWHQIQNALGNSSKEGTVFLFMALGLMPLIAFFFLYRMTKRTPFG